ncbi:MAG: hypothetical protein FJZ95_05330 [Chloroflexi bacterium]|nr:hypothetical protein [Chloroflexota bacterium]
MQGRVITCYTCGKELEHHTGLPPCEELAGWITVSFWKGKESVDHYSFCSAPCLQEWAEEQSTRIPEVFLKSFDDQASES